MPISKENSNASSARPPSRIGRLKRQSILSEKTNVVRAESPKLSPKQHVDFDKPSTPKVAVADEDTAHITAVLRLVGGTPDSDVWNQKAPSGSSATPSPVQQSQPQPRVSRLVEQLLPRLKLDEEEANESIATVVPSPPKRQSSIKSNWKRDDVLQKEISCLKRDLSRELGRSKEFQSLLAGYDGTVERLVTEMDHLRQSLHLEKENTREQARRFDHKVMSMKQAHLREVESLQELELQRYEILQEEKEQLYAFCQELIGKLEGAGVN